MTPAPNCFEGTGRLAERVRNGEVVFFVGSGFSVDSEQNSAVRLVGRLLAGILAMITALGEEQDADAGEARHVFLRLAQVFELQSAIRPPGAPLEPARCMTRDILKLLARDYYNFNEWSVSALTVLSGELLKVETSRRSELTKRIEALATFFLKLVDDPEPLDPIDCTVLEKFADNAARGKALFLDIMGFANEAVMAGSPTAPNIETVVTSYRGRLRPRHQALARLAREGKAPALVTTNYDLLLEGAYRLAGFVDREKGDDIDDLPPSAVPRFSCIAGADQFFSRGEGYRTALLLKIHGSVSVYRDVRDARINPPKPAGDGPLRRADDDPLRRADDDPWSAYLPAMVFTYREIQTWRTDAWSRDLIRTFLRTHTLALCGYSGADPVMHSTFREVYEERASARRTDVQERKKPERKDAPVFFFGIADRREFYSLEILRAASSATGFAKPELLDHPNHIEFSVGDGFPTIDDHFRWLVHCVVRDVQWQALTTRLRRVMPKLLRHDSPDKEVEDVCSAFERLRERELAAVASIADLTSGHPPEVRRRTFEQVVGWTWHFVPGLLRELALAELVEGRRGAGRQMRLKRAFPWYQAASDRLEWTAWTGVVELALRRLIDAVRDIRTGSVMAEESPHAAASFSLSDQQVQPYAICVRLAGFERHDRPPALTGAFRRVTYWEFGEREIPWPLRPAPPCPRPGDLWTWAAGGAVNRKSALQHLGVQP